MRIVRLNQGGRPHFAEVLEPGHARLFTATPWCGGVATDDVVSYEDDALLCPATPTKIVCVGRNYRAHAA